MMDVEYRAYIRVPLDVEGEQADALLVALNHKYEDSLGPVLSGESDGLDVILVTERDDRVEAAGEMYDAVVDALRVCGLTDLYPTRVEVEPAGDRVAA